MTIDEVIQLTKQALENVNPDKRVYTEFRYTVEQVKQLLEWLEDYKRLKDEMIPAYDEAEIDAVIAEIQRCTDLSTPGFVIRSAETLRDEIAMLKDYKQLKADYADLDNKIRTANTQIDRLQSVSSWISCSVKLPEVGEPVLIYEPYNEEMVVASLDCDKTGFSNEDFWYGLKNVPFWMALPEAPKEE